MTILNKFGCLVICMLRVEKSLHTARKPILPQSRRSRLHTCDQLSLQHISRLVSMSFRPSTNLLWACVASRLLSRNGKFLTQQLHWLVRCATVLEYRVGLYGWLLPVSRFQPRGSQYRLRSTGSSGLCRRTSKTDTQMCYVVRDNCKRA